MATLATLPPEILGTLAEWLPRQDFRNLRLTSTYIGNSLRPFLAHPCFTGLPWKRDAQRLLALSEIPECQGRIRTIHYLFGRLDERAVLYANNHTEQHVNDLAEDDNTELAQRIRETSLTKKRHWAAYYETVRQGKENGPFHRESFARALERLTALDELILTWSECPHRETSIKDVFEPDESIELTRETMGETQQLVLNKLWELDIPLKSLTIEPMALHDLTMPTAPLPQSLFSALEHFHIEAIAELFQPHRLEYLLSHMKNLRRFCLQFVGLDQTHFDREFLPSTTLPNLRFISLTCAEFSLDSFASFLRRHKETLETVALCHLRGLPGEDGMPTLTTWEDIFKLLREELPKLTSVDIEGLFATRRGTRVEFYKQEEGTAPPPNGIEPSMVPSRVIEDWIMDGGEFPDLPWMENRLASTNGWIGDFVAPTQGEWLWEVNGDDAEQ